MMDIELKEKDAIGLSCNQRDTQEGVWKGEDWGLDMKKKRHEEKEKEKEKRKKKKEKGKRKKEKGKRKKEKRKKGEKGGEILASEFFILWLALTLALAQDVNGEMEMLRGRRDPGFDGTLRLACICPKHLI